MQYEHGQSLGLLHSKNDLGLGETTCAQRAHAPTPSPPAPRRPNEEHSMARQRGASSCRAATNGRPVAMIIRAPWTIFIIHGFALIASRHSHSSCRGPSGLDDDDISAPAQTMPQSFVSLNSISCGSAASLGLLHSRTRLPPYAPAAPTRQRRGSTRPTPPIRPCNHAWRGRSCPRLPHSHSRMRPPLNAPGAPTRQPAAQPRNKANWCFARSGCNPH